MSAVSESPGADRTLEDLLEGVKGATEGGPALDWAVAEALGEVPEHSVLTIGWDYDWWRSPGEFGLRKATDGEGRQIATWYPAAVSTSLDAVVALCERSLPGCMWSVCVMEEGPYGQLIRPMPGGSFTNGCTGAYGASAPLALLAALLEALVKSRSPSLVG